MNRRILIKNLTLSSFLLPSVFDLRATEISENLALAKLKNNINHSVCAWTFNQLSIEELCLLVKKIGFEAIDLVEPKDFAVLKKYNIYCSMCTGAQISLTEGWNNTKNHEILIKNYTKHINLVADAGFKNLICFSGNRNGMSNDDGLQNCIIGLHQILPLAEKRGIILQMELFNSKVDHPDYMVTAVFGALNCAKSWVQKILNCCLIFITCKLWKVILSETFKIITNISVIIIQQACQAEMKLEVTKSFFILRL